jgi:hypothetical protein
MVTELTSPPPPPRPADLENYLTSEVGPRGSVAVIDSVLALFNWHCAEVGKDSPFLNKRIVLIVKGMKRVLHKQTVPRLPFLRSHVKCFLGLRQTALLSAEGKKSVY